MKLSQKISPLINFSLKTRFRFTLIAPSIVQSHIDCYDTESTTGLHEQLLSHMDCYDTEATLGMREQFYDKALTASETDDKQRPVFMFRHKIWV